MAGAVSEETVRVAVLRARWLTMTFLHWRYDAEMIQAMLPEGLVVDTYDGSAWVTLAPFLMADVRPPLLPTTGRQGAGAQLDDLLTPREQEVLQLVAQGRSNREIGAQLFISGKTVSVHVSNILAKLGARGRLEAVTVARRRGLLED